VILLVLVVVLWIAVLVPGAIRRRSERQGAGSIDHFHHQLELLEHAGPKLVNPAYRLETAFPGGGSPERAISDLDSSRPKLVLLRPTDDAYTADVGDSDGCLYERVGVLSAPEPPEQCAEPRIELAAYRRQQARARCTMLLRGLTAMVLVTGVIGAIPGLHLAWAFTGVFGLSALGLVGLIGYARELEAERRRRSRYASTPYWDDVDVDYAPMPASAGYPGAWDLEDEEYEMPRQAAAQ
jgi:hypothetical protein